MNVEKIKKKQKKEAAKLTPEQKKAKKAARKAEKKKIRLQKKLAKENRYRLYDPGRMQSFKLSLAFGYFLRFFAIAFSLFGVCIMVVDAFALPGINWVLLLAYCVGMVTAFSLVFIGKWMSLIGFALIGAYVGLFFPFVGNLLTFYVSGTERMINLAMNRLSEAGFASLSNVSLPYFGGISDGALNYGGIFAIATVLALIFSAFSAKRTRLLPMIVFGGGLCSVCFTYNLTTSNWGIACVLAGLCSAIVLSSYDKIYRKHKKSKKSRAYSGYSAALAGLLAMIMVLGPTVLATKPFTDIPFISEPMENARMIVTTVLTGGNPKYNKMNNPQKHMSAGIEDIEFEDVLLFKVGSATSKRNIYLRSWIGSDYDFGKDAWTVLDEDSYQAMRKKLTSEYNGFTGDDITTMLYELSDPALTQRVSTDRAYQNLTFGAVSTYVNVEYVANTGLLYLMPSAYDSVGGLRLYSESSEKYDESYSIFSDGMYRSSWFNLKKSYGAFAIMPSYIDSGYAENAENMVKYYELFIRFISSSGNPSGSAGIDAFRQLLAENGVTGGVEAMSAYMSLTDSEKATYRKKCVNLIKQYTDYVSDYYGSVDPTAGLQSAYDAIKPAFDEAETTHDKLMSVINYLVDNCEYSTTPKKPEGNYESDVDAFLLETKEGYCVQFATAATLLFRMFGYPARYVQGYIASNFKASDTEDEEQTMPYYANVTDRGAHAWVEVYIDGLGWRTYEATPVYYTNIYEYNPNLSGSIDKYDPDFHLPDPTDPVDEPPEEDPKDPEEEPDDPDAPDDDEIVKVNAFDFRLLIKILAVLLILGVIALLIIWQYRRARKITDGRSYYIERAIYGTFENEADKNRIAGVICDSIYEVHYVIGNRPKLGEDPTEFAYRVDHPAKASSKSELKKRQRAIMMPSTLGQITVLLEKQEFGRALEREDLTALGEYLSALIKAEYRALPIHKKLWYRYIRFMI